MTTTIDQIFALIAQKHLFIDTLETRHSDRLDFHDVAVWSVRDALEAAFKAGSLPQGCPLRGHPFSSPAHHSPQEVRQIC
ncbi:MAG: hypothetical protein PHQ58_02915 [Rhodoferax sp.]|uniref:DUF6900 domain-containing protein n=1 Tax=Rhodoferax sp. TaxID=50421 RepID=UPI00260C5FB9|nr:hypothetical protein [Rhodoferax sp.]MDD2879363.1 hypothetical protein [Rhodoferax sp.]